VGRSGSVHRGVGNGGRGADTRGVDRDNSCRATDGGSSRGGVGRSGGRADNVAGGVLAVIVDNGGGLGDDVGLGADGEGGSLGADSRQSLVNLGGVDGVCS
jgi:hypothetical protein